MFGKVVEVVRTGPSKGAAETAAVRAGESKWTWAGLAHASGRRARENKQRI